MTDLEARLAGTDSPFSREAAGLPNRARATGINVIGDFTADIGLGEAARATLGAILRRGIPVTYNELRYPFARRAGAFDLAAGLPRENLYPTNLLYYNFDQMIHIGDDHLESATHGKYTIGFWVWELPRFPERYRTQFLRVDEIWTPSRYTKASMSAATAAPITVVPHPIEVETSPNVSPGDFGLPADRFIFLFSFAATSSFARKNPWGFVDAFHRAFGSGEPDGPLLVIKAHHLDLNPRLRQVLRDQVRSVGGVLIEEALPRRRVNDLLAVCDAYVSLHRSEGFGLGMAEAMYLGKPVIATNYSANVDYMAEDNSYPVPYRLRPIVAEDHEYEREGTLQYEPGQLWAEPDVETAASLMARVFENRDEARERGVRAAADIRAYCSPVVVGDIIDRRLAEIETEPRSPRAARRLQQAGVDVVAYHRQALDEWNAAKHLADCIPMAHRPGIGRFAEAAAHVPVLGSLIHGVQSVRFLRLINARQAELNQIQLEEAQVFGRTIEAIGELADEAQGALRVVADATDAIAAGRADRNDLRQAIDEMRTRLTAIDELSHVQTGRLRGLRSEPDVVEGNTELPSAGGLVQMIRMLEQHYDQLAGATDIGLTLSDVSAEEQLLAAANFLGGRLGKEGLDAAYGAWYHVGNPDDCRRSHLFESAASKLKAGGYLVLVTRPATSSVTPLSGLMAVDSLSLTVGTESALAQIFQAPEATDDRG
ncbi:MAG TPA: glycosyltransferase [Chloroflexota bacterium]|nr:glycosyltransferase [Chloroflexota bacterium]